MSRVQIRPNRSGHIMLKVVWPAQLGTKYISCFLITEFIIVGQKKLSNVSFCTAADEL